MFRRFVCFFSVLSILVALFATSRHTQVVAASNPDLAELSKTCQVIAVVNLQGNIQSAQCVKQRQQGDSIKVLVRGVDCEGNFYGYAEEIVIWNYNYTSSLCFYGDQRTSYLGVNIYQVNEIKNVAGTAGWFRWYPAGTYRVLSGNGGDFSWGNGNTGVEITQLCIGSAVGGQC